MRDVKAYLAKKQIEGGPLENDWAELSDLYDKKLWHQLTIRTNQLVKHEYFEQNEGLCELYENVISDFEHRINTLSLLEILMFVVREIKDPQKAVEFLDLQKEKIKGDVEAEILRLTTIGTIKLKSGMLEETKAAVEEAQTLMDTIDGVTTVHARFYDLSSNYYKVVGSYNEYYRDALRFLGCTDIAEIKRAELQERAFNLSLAALLGSDVYNFGELLAHKVLETLNGTEHAWLVDLLYAFNSGDLNKFESLSSKWQQQPDLAKSNITLRQKIRLLCLMELTFNRPPSDRNLSFKEIAREAQVPLDEVELLVMKALSLGLVKGSIDEVEQMVHMTWVQPRVLDLKQIANMQERLSEWCEKVKSTVYIVEDQVPELLV